MKPSRSATDETGVSPIRRSEIDAPAGIGRIVGSTLRGEPERLLQATSAINAQSISPPLAKGGQGGSLRDFTSEFTATSTEDDALAHPHRHISTQPRSVHDITGAGDTVLAVLACFLAEGRSLAVAAELANRAAALEFRAKTMTPDTGRSSR